MDTVISNKYSSVLNELDIEVSKNTTFPGDELILTETVVKENILLMK